MAVMPKGSASLVVVVLACVFALPVALRAQRHGAPGPLLAADGSVDWNRYYSSGETNAILAHYARRYPQLTKLYPVGRSWRGADLMLIEVTNTATGPAAEKPALYLDGGIHAGELTGSTRPWQFGDEQPIDVVRTLTNAVRRGGVPEGGRIRLSVEDFEVAETERRGRAAVSVLIDMSYSMVLRDTWTQAKTTALALHALVTGMYPSDAVQLIGFSRYAQEISPTQLATLEPETLAALDEALNVTTK